MEDCEIVQMVVLTHCEKMIRHSIPMCSHMRHAALQPDRGSMRKGAGAYREKKLRPAPRMPAAETTAAMPHTSHR